MTLRDPGWTWKLIRFAVLLLDLSSLGIGLVFASLARYEADLYQVNIRGLVLAFAIALALYLAASIALRLHQGRYSIGSLEEAKALGAATGFASLGVLVADLALSSPRPVPLSVPIVAGLLSFLLIVASRLAVRSQREGAVRPRTGNRTLVFGAGVAGEQLIRSMLGDPDSTYIPVGLLDDDPRKRHLRIRSVRMLGNRNNIADAARATNAEIVVLAQPSADSTVVRELSRKAQEAGLTVKVLPRVSDLLDRKVGIRDVRDINVADLLGRRQIDTDVAAIAHYLKGKRVLVTGAGGSIGSELCRQIATFAPAQILMLDRDESALHALQLSIFGEARLDLPEAILADIRDREALMRLFAERQPHVVFHAAALKHVNMLEQYPDEGLKTNVLGTRNVLEAAASVPVTNFINISTDKAANPINVLGRTKRMAEQLTASYAEPSAGRYLSVRFGNVLGSRGSVLETFAAQIARGGPVTVTHPNVTRYFMTIPEAVQLVVQAGAIGNAGEALVLDMGQPVKIADVAAHLISLEDQPVSIRFTGLRPGEKLHEELFSSDEEDRRPIHRMISHVRVPALSEGVLEALEDALRPVVSRGRSSAGEPQFSSVATAELATQ